MSRQIVTDFRDWRDIFASEEVIPDIGAYSKRGHIENAVHTWTLPPALPERRERKMWIGGFVSLKRLDRTIWLHVHPTAKVIEAITPHVTFVEDDVMNFKAIEWDDGRTLITCENGRIIAGPWVAKIDSVTIPDFREE